MICRRTFLTLFPAAAISLSLYSQGTEKIPPMVVFVCEHGAAKSVIAAAHFNKLAQERGLPHRAISRGTNPDPTVSGKVIAGLQEEGVPVTTGKPQLVSSKDLSSASKIVTLGCKLPEPARAANWDDVPSVSENYSAASAAIRRHVENLMSELAPKPAVRKP